MGCRFGDGGGWYNDTSLFLSTESNGPYLEIHLGGVQLIGTHENTSVSVLDMVIGCFRWEERSGLISCDLTAGDDHRSSTCPVSTLTMRIGRFPSWMDYYRMDTTNPKSIEKGNSGNNFGRTPETTSGTESL